MAFRKAERRKAKLRLAITGPAGSGKTYGALLVAMGLGGKIAMLDTENGSGDLYADNPEIGEYSIEQIQAPYEIEKYIKAIKTAEQLGFDVIIIDSLSPAWNGEGGLLEKKGELEESRRYNNYTAWNPITKDHNALINAMLTSKCHIIATMRSKMDYVQDKDERGKTVVRKVGLAPVQRDGMEYEFGTVFDLNANHSATVSKDRTNLFDGQVFMLSKGTGEKLKTWLESGVDVPAPARTFPEKVEQAAQQVLPQAQPHSPTRAEYKSRLYHGYLDFYGGDAQLAQEAIQTVTEGRGSKEWTDEDMSHLAADLNQKCKQRDAQANAAPASLPPAVNQ